MASGDLNLKRLGIISISGSNLVLGNVNDLSGHKLHLVSTANGQGTEVFQEYVTT